MIKITRFLIGKILLFLNALFSPSSLKRTPEAQAQVDSQTKSLSLYQFEMCPFCIKVRRQIKRLGLKIEMIDAKIPENEKALISGGGHRKVPCLLIEKQDMSSKWLYESNDINAYLEKNFGSRV